MTEHAYPDDRLDLHNPSVDEEVAATGVCAQVHLPSGRTCTLVRHHEGSCNFVSRDEAAESITQHRLVDDT
jgi:hypothetical protein